MTKKTYAEKWETPVGADCIDLCSTLPKWLGERLVHLGEYTNGTPYSYCMKFVDPNDDNKFDDEAAHAAWKADLTTHGNALLKRAEDDSDETLPAAQEALHWVADNFVLLWD